MDENRGRPYKKVGPRVFGLYIICFCSSIILLPATSFAEIYTWIDENGEKQFSQRPPRDLSTEYQVENIEATKATGVRPVKSKGHEYCGSRKLSSYGSSKKQIIKNHKSTLKKLKKTERSLKQELLDLEKKDSYYQSSYRVRKRTEKSQKLREVQCTIGWIEEKLSSPELQRKEYVAEYKQLSLEKHQLQKEMQSRCGKKGDIAVNPKNQKQTERCINEYQDRIAPIDARIGEIELVLPENSTEVLFNRLDKNNVSSILSNKEILLPILGSKNVEDRLEHIEKANGDEFRKPFIKFLLMLSRPFLIHSEKPDYEKHKLGFSYSASDAKTILSDHPDSKYFEPAKKFLEGHAVSYDCDSRRCFEEKRISNLLMLMENETSITELEIYFSFLEPLVKSDINNIKNLPPNKSETRESRDNDALKDSVRVALEKIETLALVDQDPYAERIKLLRAQFYMSNMQFEKANDLLSNSAGLEMSSEVEELLSSLPSGNILMYSPKQIKNESIVLDWSLKNVIKEKGAEEIVLLVSKQGEDFQEIKYFNLDQTSFLYSLRTSKEDLAFKLKVAYPDGSEGWSNTVRINYATHLDDVIFSKLDGNTLYLGLLVNGWEELLTINFKESLAYSESQNLILSGSCDEKQQEYFDTGIFFDRNNNEIVSIEKVKSFNFLESDANLSKADLVKSCKVNDLGEKNIFYDDNTRDLNFLNQEVIKNANGSYFIIDDAKDDIIISRKDDFFDRYASKEHFNESFDLFAGFYSQDRLYIFDESTKKLSIFSDGGRYLGSEFIAGLEFGKNAISISDSNLFWVNNNGVVSIFDLNTSSIQYLDLIIEPKNIKKVYGFFYNEAIEKYILVFSKTDEHATENFYINLFSGRGNLEQSVLIEDLRNLGWVAWKKHKFKKSYAYKNPVVPEKKEVKLKSARYDDFDLYFAILYRYVELTALVIIAYIIFRKRRVIPKPEDLES